MKQMFLYSFLLFFAPQAQAAPANNTVAVLSVERGAYLEAFSAFQAAYGEVPHYSLAAGKPAIPATASLVAAFGGKAASYLYPPGTSVVYCMAPGILLRPRDGVKLVKISLFPEFSEIFSLIKEVQPKIKRLHIFWMEPSFSQHIEQLKAEGERHSLEVTAVRAESPQEVPAMLRRAAGAADAFWLPPDPLLITRENILIMRDFSWANGIPFYGSTKSMTQEGAVASIGVSFKELGRTAALTAQRLKAGEILPKTIFPEKTEITLNAAAAKKCGIVFPRAVLDKAGYFFP